MAVQRLRRRRVPTTSYARLENAALAAVVSEGGEIEGRESGLYNPAPRGSVAKASASVEIFRSIAPQSPRPAEMLDTVTVKGDGMLSARDLAIHEYLVAAAYEAAYVASEQGTEREVVGQELEVPMKGVLAFLGTSARRAHVLKSVAALNRTSVSYSIPGGRTVTDVPLLVGWHESGAEADVVRFSLPSRVWWLLASQPSYAYLELAALATMSSRYGIHLYRHLALRMSRTRWDPMEPDTVLHYSPEEAAAAIGYDEAPMQVGRLTTALKRAVSDLKEVRRFRVEYAAPRRRAAKGAPISAFVLQIAMLPPQVETAKLGGIHKSAKPFTGAPDVPDLRVNSHVWDKASELARQHGRRIAPNYISGAWFGSLHEAYGGGPTDRDAARKEYRGAVLLRAIRAHGPDRAAFAWFTEELKDPDLLAEVDHSSELDRRFKYEAAGEKARRIRLRDYKHGDRKQRAARLPKPTREQRFAKAVAKVEAGKAERLKRFADATVVELDVAYDGINDARRMADDFTRRTWRGNRLIELRLSHLVRDDIVTEVIGRYPASVDDLESVLSRPDIISGYRPIHDPTVEAPVVTGPRRPAFLPGSKPWEVVGGTAKKPSDDD